MNKQLMVMNLKDIKAYKNNPRHNDEAVEAVMASIEQCEYIAPIIVDEANVILAGHTRYKALKRLGYTEAETLRVSGLTEEQKKKYRLLDNKTNELATWDFNALALELDGLNFGKFDFGFEEAILDEGYGTEFELPDGDKCKIVVMSFTVHEEQKALIEYAMGVVKNDITETFGNTNKNGNALYEVVRQWAELRE